MRIIVVGFAVLVSCGQPAEPQPTPGEEPAPAAAAPAAPVSPPTAPVGEERAIPPAERSKVTIAFEEAALRDVVTYLAQVTGRELTVEGELALDAVVTADSGPIEREDVPAWATGWLREQGYEASFDAANLTVRKLP